MVRRAPPAGQTRLYRFYSGDVLLYVGITHRMGERAAAHRSASSWYDLADRVTLETFPHRVDALRAEARAIAVEGPSFNVVGRHGAPRATSQAPRTPPSVGDRLVFESQRTGHPFEARLQLYPELDGSACVDGRDGDPLTVYRYWVERHHPEWLAQDATPIVWSVVDHDAGICESAPFQEGYECADFLTVFTWPVDVRGERLDFRRLPVVNDRFPAFAAALDWLPLPLQRFAPLRTILAAHQGRT